MSKKVALSQELIPNNELTRDVPIWSYRGISRRAKNGKLVIVSAVCPDYAITKDRITYASMGEGLPFLASKHLEIMKIIVANARKLAIGVEYHITLADTEFDLPGVVGKMANGSTEEFLRRCQRSCDLLAERAYEMGLPLATANRFTTSFPDWFRYYNEAVAYISEEVKVDSSIRMNLESLTCSREPLYRAMTNAGTTQAYCREMVIRQWAQYMAFGKCARHAYGEDFILMNHDTPNLSRINHPHFAQGRERIPIIKLALSTMPALS